VQLFSLNLSEKELQELKRLLIAYKAARLFRKADEVWEAKGWSQDTMDQFLQTHLRTPYKPLQIYLTKKVLANREGSPGYQCVTGSDFSKIKESLAF